jgi:hypothetical protein
MKITLEDDNGDEIKLPMKRIICPRCDGCGHHDHPAFSNGITASEWNGDDWDDDSRADYLRGRFDVRCEECGGSNVVEVPDEERMSPDLIQRLHDYYRAENEWAAEQRMERLMGC